MIHEVIFRYLLPLLAYGFVTGLANLLLSKRSQVELWAESHPKAAALQKLLRAIGLDPWQIISAISLWATSKLPDAQRSEFLKATDPKPKTSPPSNPMGPMGGMLALGVLLAAFTACAASNPHVCNPVDAVKLTSAYAANVHLQCQGYSFDACPARPALEADLSKQLENACPTH